MLRRPLRLSLRPFALFRHRRPIVPLESGSSKAAFSHNISEERKAGKPEDQAVAIAYSKQRGDASVREVTKALLAKKIRNGEWEAETDVTCDGYQDMREGKNRFTVHITDHRSDDSAPSYLSNSAKLDVALAKCVKMDSGKPVTNLFAYRWKGKDIGKYYNRQQAENAAKEAGHWPTSTVMLD